MSDSAIIIIVFMIMSCVIMMLSSSSSSALIKVNSGYSKPKDEVKPGIWNSRKYGSENKETKKHMCPSGSYISDMILFHGQGDSTNAWNGYCFNPDTESVTRIFRDNVTCGKRDRPDIGKGFSDVFSSIGNGLSSLMTMNFGGVATDIKARVDAQKDILTPGFGRSLWKPIHFSSPVGINAWEIIPKENEIKGLQLHGIDGTPSGWAGGPSYSGADSVKQSIKYGKCPKGKVLVGITSGCGDRVDTMRFHCDVPSNPTGYTQK